MRLQSGTTDNGLKILTEIDLPIRTFFTPAYASDSKHYALLALIPLYGITDGTKHPYYKLQYVFRVKSVGGESDGGMNSEVILVFERANNVNSFQIQIKDFASKTANSKISGVFIDNTIRLYLYVDNAPYRVDVISITKMDGSIYENDTTTGLQLESNTGTLVASIPSNGTSVAINPVNVTSAQNDQNCTGNGTIDLYQGYTWNLYGNGGTSLPITFTNFSPQSKVATLIFRSTNGATPLTLAFSSNIKLPSGFPTTASYQTAVACQFIFHSVLNVWLCVNWVNVPTGL